MNNGMNWKGMPIEDLTREELIDAFKELEECERIRSDQVRELLRIIRNETGKKYNLKDKKFI